MQHQVFIIENHPEIREAYQQIIEREPDLHICGEAEVGDLALQMLPELDPGVVVLDLGLPGMSGIRLIEEIKRQRPELPILIVSGLDALVYGALALEAGASGYLDKINCFYVLADAIRQVVRGARYVDEQAQHIPGRRERTSHSAG